MYLEDYGVVINISVLALSFRGAYEWENHYFPIEKFTLDVFLELGNIKAKKYLICVFKHGRYLGMLSDFYYYPKDFNKDVFASISIEALDLIAKRCV